MVNFYLLWSHLGTILVFLCLRISEEVIYLNLCLITFVSSINNLTWNACLLTVNRLFNFSTGVRVTGLICEILWWSHRTIELRVLRLVALAIELHFFGLLLILFLFLIWKEIKACFELSLAFLQQTCCIIFEVTAVPLISFNL